MIVWEPQSDFRLIFLLWLFSFIFLKFNQFLNYLFDKNLLRMFFRSQTVSQFGIFNALIMSTSYLSLFFPLSISAYAMQGQYHYVKFPVVPSVIFVSFSPCFSLKSLILLACSTNPSWDNPTCLQFPGSPYGFICA